MNDKRKLLTGPKMPVSVRSFGGTTKKGDKPMELGAFPISQAVKDIKASKEFYEKLGFEEFNGNT